MQIMDIVVDEKPVPYKDAIKIMEQRVADIREGCADELLWLLEHPPIYTGGTSAKSDDLLNPRFPVFKTGRGGEYTYHGPGQRVAYVMLDLKKRQSVPDIKKYVWQLEEWIIKTLYEYGIKGERRQGRVGIWVETGASEKKIAAIGVRIRHWVSYHGIAVNLDPDLSHFEGIVPCGIKEYGVTSFRDLLGEKVSRDDFDKTLIRNFSKIFPSVNDGALNKRLVSSQSG